MIFVTLISLTLVMGLIACSESNEIDVVATMQKAVAVETTNAEYYATVTKMFEPTATSTPKPTGTPFPTFTPTPASTNTPAATNTAVPPTATPIVPERIFYPVHIDAGPYWLEKIELDSETTRLIISDTLTVDVHTNDESGNLLPYGVEFQDGEFAVDLRGNSLDIERYDENEVYPEIRQGFVLTKTNRVTFVLQEGSIVTLVNEKVYREEHDYEESLDEVEFLFTVIDGQIVYLAPDFFFDTAEYPPFDWSPIWWHDEVSLAVLYQAGIHCEVMCGTHDLIVDQVPYGEGSKIDIQIGGYLTNNAGSSLVYPRIDLTVDD